MKSCRYCVHPSKKIRYFFLLLIISIIGLTYYFSKISEPKLIPLSAFFKPSNITDAKISPDGKQLSYKSPVNKVLNVFVKTIGKNDDRQVTEETDRSILSYFWDFNSKNIYYLQDQGGNENYQLFSVNLETKTVKNLTPFKDVKIGISQYLKQYPNKMLIEMNKIDKKVFDVYELDLLTGELKLIEKNPGNIIGWIPDTKLNIRGALTSLPDGSGDLLIKNGKTNKWETFIHWDANDFPLNQDLFQFSADGKSIYLKDSRDYNSFRLLKIDLKDKKTDIIAQDPVYDIKSVMINPDTFEIEAVSFEKEKICRLFFDQKVKDDFYNIAKLDNGEFAIMSVDLKNNIWIVAFTKDDGPVSFWTYNRTTKKGELLFYTKPQLLNYKLAKMEPLLFKSRDGLDIHGYITYPVLKERKNLPMVLLVHGGPWGIRDSWGYQPEVQWLANRGYVVVQINYRGSGGYGKNFLNASTKEWGGKMHDDLVDGVNYIIKQGIIDPKKIAIFGGSYGGYAALIGATFTPDLFCCAISEVGPSNLLTFIKSIPPYWENALGMLHQRIGNPDTEAEFLKSRSPLFKINAIKIPMLIAQGANDPRVKKEESEQIVAAMKAKGIKHQYLLFQDEGHGFLKEENRMKFYCAAEKFLAENLGGRSEC